MQIKALLPRAAAIPAGALGICPRAVKLRIVSVEVAIVHVVLRDPECLAEALIMHKLALTQESYGIAYVGIVNEPENVVV